MPETPRERGAHFDGQASEFDRRAGLPAHTRSRIADAIVAIARLAPGDRVLDVGAGTGGITLELLERGLTCAALDESSGMLDVLRRKAPASAALELLVGDARGPWPVSAGSLKLVFGSRSLHWLSEDHVCAEAFRVASPAGSLLLVGRVERDPLGIRGRIRTEMRAFLRAAGVEGRSGESSTRALVAACAAKGAEPIAKRVVATWTARVTARAVVEGWRRKEGLAGTDVAEPLKREVLGRTLAWAAAELGDIDAPTESEECYTLEGAVLVPPSLSPQ